MVEFFSAWLVNLFLNKLVNFFKSLKKICRTSDMLLRRGTEDLIYQH